MARTTKAKAESIPPTENLAITETVAAPVLPVTVYFQEASWKGVITVWKCEICNHCENEKDDMILHILRHVPASEQNDLLDKLTKGK